MAARIDQLEGQQVVDADYYTNEDGFTIPKRGADANCLYDFHVDAGNTFEISSNWSSTSRHTDLSLRKDGVDVAYGFGDMNYRDQVNVQYAGRTEQDALFQLCYSSFVQDEWVWPKGISYSYKVYGPEYVMI